MYTFRQEYVTKEQVRYSLETGGSKYYLMVALNGNVNAMQADDLMLGSQNDKQSRFRYFYG